MNTECDIVTCKIFDDEKRRDILNIFLSHNCKDKPIVGQIAIRLKEIYGEESVFYDSWSIQPGEGIIDKMNEGLLKADFFFFFISKNSLASSMVKLEWQNALMMKTQDHKLKFIPVRLDESSVPAILKQTLYIDFYTNRRISISLGGIASYLVFVRQAALPINQFTQQSNLLLNGLAGAERLFKMMDEKCEIDDGEVTLVNVEMQDDKPIVVDHKSNLWAWKKPDGELVLLKGENTILI